nr:MAG TPA: hypothetical protein [Bacteriophage sp.]
MNNLAFNVLILSLRTLLLLSTGYLVTILKNAVLVT